MECLEPKKEALLLAIICILGSIICYMFTNLNIVTIIDILIFAIISLIMHFVLQNIDIRIGNFLFYISLLVGLFIMNTFNNSTIAFNMKIKNWEKNIINVAIDNCTSRCNIKERNLYNFNNNEIYKWYDSIYINDGIIYSTNTDIYYKISVGNKCVTKELGKEFIITDGKCIKNEQT